MTHSHLTLATTHCINSKNTTNSAPLSDTALALAAKSERSSRWTINHIKMADMVTFRQNRSKFDRIGSGNNLQN